MASIKGKLFEYFVFRLLVSCGFKPVIPDGLLVYKGGPGLMVQGIGQPHNADVLLTPPIQTPFYYPTRLLVECKCYDKPIGLPQIRNALGLRDDINNFEIVTQAILKNRQSARSAGPKFYDMKRYVYQVAVASIDGFKFTAFPFAKAHRIPLISFGSSGLFAGVRKVISDLDDFAKENTEFAHQISSCISDAMMCPEYRIYLNDVDCNEWNSYVQEIERIEEFTTIGLLEDGTILFLLQADEKDRDFYTNYIHNDGCTIHWNREQDGSWVLNDRGSIYYFELPTEIYDNWERSAGKQRRDALRVKRDYFSKIVLFGKANDNEENISILHLSEDFMNNAERSVEEDEN
ncbi:MAG: hypothetical protein IKC26_00260 [Clostridia bacterium]|nr:hypothetical protein [Clostridia bacterium]